jgi:predicted nucleotidyltransferase component of viral defense system
LAALVAPELESEHQAPMIDRAEILAASADLSLAPEVIEKDYVLGWLLAGIFRSAELAPTWHFKGGTCLKKCYFETYRFSEDLDFTLTDRTHLNADVLKDAFANIAAWLYDQTGIEIPANQLRFEVLKNPRGGVSCEGRVYYNGPLRHTGSIPRIKLDLTADELLALPATDRPVGHPYSDAPDGGIVARCYAFEELFAEKLRALTERTRPRDLYDVVNLFRHGEFRPAVAAIVDVLRRKSRPFPAR